jgi:hypothetical protein
MQKMQKNEKDYSSIGSLHDHLFKWGFKKNYFVWTNHGERGVIMEDDEEDDTIPDWSQFGAFADEAMEEDFKEMGEDQGPFDAFGEVWWEAKENCMEMMKESKKCEHVLEDHKKPLYQIAKMGTRSWVAHWKCCNGRLRISDTTFDELLLIMKDMLPEGNELSVSRTKLKGLFVLWVWR